MAISRERIERFNPVTDVLDVLLRDEDIKRLQEELGIDVNWVEELGTIDAFTETVNSIIATFADKTSTVHVGLPLRVELPEHLYDAIKLDPAEFCNYQWLTPQELKMGDREWETWSQLLIKEM